MSDDIAFMPVAQLLGAFRTKSITPVEAVEAALGRIGAHNGVLNAFCHVDEDGARAAARASQARWMKGEPQGLLDGLPLSVKDSLMVKGMPARYGSKTTSADPVAEDTSTVASARRHGAVILGKTTTPEYGLGAVTNSPLTGITLNPWDTDKTSGGSSGGGAAAVAAGMGNAALGTDAGGSIRIPASLNGLVALKSTNGRIPQYPLTWVPSLMALSVLTHTVTDSALMLNVLSEPDPRDAPAFPADGVDYLEGLDDGIAGLRIAFSATLGYAPHVNAEVAELAAAGGQELRTTRRNGSRDRSWLRQPRCDLPRHPVSELRPLRAAVHARSDGTPGPRRARYREGRWRHVDRRLLGGRQGARGAGEPHASLPPDP